MDLRLKLWHILTFFGIVIAGGSIFIGMWVSNNNANIARLNREIRAYDKQIKALEIDYKALEKQDEAKAITIDSLLQEIDSKDAKIKSLGISISKIKKELQYEKDRIRALDSTEQFSLARTNLDIMLRRAGSAGD